MNSIVSKLLFLFLFVAPLEAQITRYVSITGNDHGGANSCADPNAPCQTINQAIYIALNGDIIQIGQGVYTELLELEKSLSIQGAGQGVTVIQSHAEKAKAVGQVIRIIDVPEVMISDLTVRHGRFPGGGIYNNNSSLTLTNVTISYNSSNYAAGGMMVIDSSPTLINVTFSNNSIGGDLGGGALYNQNSSPVLIDVLFKDNKAGGRGGALYNVNSSPVLKNVVFKGNETTYGPGGAVYNENSSPEFTNVIFSGNHAVAGGGMYNADESNTMLTNVTFVGNSANGEGGGMYSFNSNVTIRNSIFWNNADANGTGTPGASVANLSSTVNIYYSMVQGCNPRGDWSWECGDENEGNIPDTDPLFYETPHPRDTPTTDGDLRLQTGSPVIDQGDPDTDLSVFPGGPGNPTDLDGNPRIFNGRIDLGAFEYTDPTSVYRIDELPAIVALYQNYPNPFNPTTTIRYSIPAHTHVELAVYDILGRMIEILIDEQQTAGSYEVHFNARGLSSGVYMYRLKTDNYVSMRQFILIK